MVGGLGDAYLRPGAAAGICTATCKVYYAVVDLKSSIEYFLCGMVAFSPTVILASSTLPHPEPVGTPDLQSGAIRRPNVILRNPSDANFLMVLCGVNLAFSIVRAFSLLRSMSSPQRVYQGYGVV